jgi:hypothetical protein
MTYDLYFNEIKIARIFNAVFEFLNCYGKYELSAEFLRDHACSELYAFIEYQLQTAPLLAAEKFDELDESEEEKFANFIDSEDWYLLDETGKKIPILVPMFNNKMDITWRYNVDYD